MAIHGRQRWLVKYGVFVYHQNVSRITVFGRFGLENTVWLQQNIWYYCCFVVSITALLLRKNDRDDLGESGVTSFSKTWGAPAPFNSGHPDCYIFLDPGMHAMIASSMAKLHFN